MAENGDTLAVEGRGQAHAAAAGPRQADSPPPGSRTAPPKQARLGEELPVFCERCGYSLHGLPQTRCDTCRVLHFNCPECGHHQPINTLRPAVQRALGRLRALGLSGIVLLKINYFFWGLFAWGGAGMGFAYSYNYAAMRAGNYQYGPAGFQWEAALVLVLFAAAFAMVGRMLLLRWRNGLLVGLALAGLVVLAMCMGAHLQQWQYRYSGERLPSPFHEGFILYMAIAAFGAAAGAACVWGVWLSLAHAFLPKRAAVGLIEWQRAMSVRDDRGAQTDAATSVTV